MLVQAMRCNASSSKLPFSSAFQICHNEMYGFPSSRMKCKATKIFGGDGTPVYFGHSKLFILNRLAFHPPTRML